MNNGFTLKAVFLCFYWTVFMTGHNVAEVEAPSVNLKCCVLYLFSKLHLKKKSLFLGLFPSSSLQLCFPEAFLLFLLFFFFYLRDVIAAVY